MSAEIKFPISYPAHHIWLRYHDSNKKLAGQELAPYLVEAMAVLPYFCGAKGVVLWGWEPKQKGQYYQTLPVFADSVGRVSDLSAKLAKAELIIDEPAHVLWKAKRPLVRKLNLSGEEWVVMGGESLAGRRSQEHGEGTMWHALGRTARGRPAYRDLRRTGRPRDKEVRNRRSSYRQPSIR